MEEKVNLHNIFKELQERNKEFNCLYQIEEEISKFESSDKPLNDIFYKVIEILPKGFQFVDLAKAVITYKREYFSLNENYDSSNLFEQEILVNDKVVGSVTVYYEDKILKSRDDYFLKEEKKLVERVADRLSHLIVHYEHKNFYKEWQKMESQATKRNGNEWRAILSMLKWSDKKLYYFIVQKMLRFLVWKGVKNAKSMLVQQSEVSLSQNLKNNNRSNSRVMDNIPSKRKDLEALWSFSEKIFELSAQHFTDKVIWDNIEDWLNEDKTRKIFKVIENPNTTLPEIINALTRFQFLEKDGLKLSKVMDKTVRVDLLRRIFSDQLSFINMAKEHIGISSYYKLFSKLIYPKNSFGRLGGKSSGLLLARQILLNSPHKDILKNLKTPKTWYITSDSLWSFIQYNNLESVMDQKYKELDEIKGEYQHIIQIFKNAQFQPEIINSLNIALDNIGSNPIIVRSSSLLEDRLGTSFSGKYKSLFLANRGSKRERLEALTDAIAEVYASTFSPDAIEYRRERNLLDFNEEMGVMIQQVVGTNIGEYFFPIFAGVAFSKNEFRWSPRIKSDEGLLRLVPGLGTRAVDRVAEDYPTLIAPKQPDLRTNINTDDLIKYSTKMVDVINLNTNTFETIELKDILKKYGDNIPLIERVVSINQDGMLRDFTSKLQTNFSKDEYVVTFNGLIKNTKFIEQITVILKTIEDALKIPVDLEFAHDGTNLYLLQCRPQACSSEFSPVPIPQDIPKSRTIFSATDYITNGSISDLRYLVFVDPQAYYDVESLSILKDVGSVISLLNSLLPKKSFILIGPGRWGSRGDIKLGVNVTYSDINNTAALIEVAQKKGNYTPELSFGTHFFQDLVESSIRYIPIYPEKEETFFNFAFFSRYKNRLVKLLPDFDYLADIVKVIDVSKSIKGGYFKLLMNAEVDQALAYVDFVDDGKKTFSKYKGRHGDYSVWRKDMAKRMAGHLVGNKYGVEALYLFGSSIESKASPESYIELIVHFTGNRDQKERLNEWFAGWDNALCEVNYLKTGYKISKILDIHFVGEEEIKSNSSHASKINSGSVLKLKMKGES